MNSKSLLSIGIVLCLVIMYFIQKGIYHLTNISIIIEVISDVIASIALFMPGFLITIIMFPLRIDNKSNINNRNNTDSMNLIERFILSSILSVVVVSLSFFFINQFIVKINHLNSYFVLFAITVVLLGLNHIINREDIQYNLEENVDMTKHEYYKRFYEEYGDLWKGKTEARKKYEIRVSKWKADTICSLINKNNLQVCSILDFGCGPAFPLKILCENLSIRTAYGIDVSASMINSAKKTFPQGKYSNNIILSKFKTHIDLITFIDVLEHVPDPVKLFNQSTKISKYQLIKVPLEFSFIRNIMKKLGLLEKSTEGHINFWNKSTIINLIKNQQVKIVDYCICNPPKELFFYPLQLRREKKTAIIKRIFLYLYDGLSLITFPFKRLHLFLFGSDIFVLTKSK